MFEILEKLVNDSSKDNKSEIIAEIKRLGELGLISVPKNFDEMLKDERFSGFKSDYDRKVGALSTKWETELKEKEDATKLAAAVTQSKANEPSEFEKNTTDAFKAINETLQNLTAAKKTEGLTSYAAAKMKDLPETLKPFLQITDSMTEEDIDNQVKTLTDLRAADLKSVDESPVVGTVTKVANAELDSFLEGKKNE